MRQADWIIVFVYCAVILAVSLYFRARTIRSVEDYFLADRKLPWWIIGFADVAGYTGGGQGFMMTFFLSGFAGGAVVENYRKARTLLTELTPWTKGRVLDALSDVVCGKQGLVDIPVPLLPSDEKYREANIPHCV